jgi:single-strand DNA-binding protein
VRPVANLNRIILVGRLTSDPETRSTMDGLSMAKFKLAVERPMGGSDFIDIVAWGKAAEIGNNLKKGKLVLVEGRVQIRSFDDQLGQRRWATEVVVRTIQALEKSGPSSQRPAAPLPDEEIVEDADLASDLPF